MFASVALALLAVGQAAAQSMVIPDLSLQVGLPINLNADSSEFDRRDNRLLFRGLTITQGTLSVRADTAEASRLDFENSQWTFRGNVEIDNGGARVYCEDARLNFQGHELKVAALAGKPAIFEQKRADGKVTRGRAATIDYDVAGGSLAMSGNAQVNDGANEVSGDRITYDLRREYVTAQSGSNGPVVFKIDPPRPRPATRTRP
ncbi:MAG: lipopolysaccharide transport periplasmic protein LptA [Gammaproteobacteria bacterium]|nr:lipopolysaccharide transport periplasmic protein LptA [Gammaproteobacteria bacterium]